MNMPANSKVEVTFEIQEEHQEWLAEMTDQFNLSDTSKALRCLFDFAIQDGDDKEIFDTIRCRHCG
jgi:hypothetical protein